MLLVTPRSTHAVTFQQSRCPIPGAAFSSPQIRLAHDLSYFRDELARHSLHLREKPMHEPPKSREGTIAAVACIWLAFYALAVVHSFVSPRSQATVTAQNDEIAIR